MLTPVTVREETIPTLRVVIPVMFAFFALSSSKNISSATYRSPPTYKSSEKVPTPTKVETPET